MVITGSTIVQVFRVHPNINISDKTVVVDLCTVQSGRDVAAFASHASAVPLCDQTPQDSERRYPGIVAWEHVIVMQGGWGHHKVGGEGNSGS